ncbi:DUF3397 domain-containing protein [Neobacillus sp. PS3-40]|uniref:DUF3397 domain-containing protein n=1 Tax=Neobacillus sp. PS3-40 TaxID=3070679 RepID=UPI0027E1D816|nr:DUF3397 domain-containing protein [Neobacillus sp. PS3-40]WML43604.1 DUF3397 domain-containing protein [Neobacillus sp. PS3-40]
MIAIFTSIIAFLITMPLIGLFTTYFVIKKRTKNHRKSLHRALDYTTIFFIFAVHFLIITIWEKSLFWLIILFLLVLALAFVIVHWKIKKEIIFLNVLRGFWRCSFLVFFLAYFTLTLLGLIQRVLAII